jgi:hypothetical protein
VLMSLPLRTQLSDCGHVERAMIAIAHSQKVTTKLPRKHVLVKSAAVVRGGAL